MDVYDYTRINTEGLQLSEFVLLDEAQAEIDRLKSALQKVVDDSVIGVVPKSHLDHIEKLLRGN